MNLSRLMTIFLLTMGLILAGCGGDGSDASATDGGGTPLASRGTIDGFGSIFVNGVEFRTDQAQVFLNSNSSTDNNLQLGMVVTVSGTVSDNESAGEASKVIFNADVEGPVSAIEQGPDGDTLSLTIFGSKVLVERTGTVVEGASFRSLAIGDFLEVSGFTDEKLRIRATRVAKKPGFQSGNGQVKLSDYVGTLTDTEFNLGDIVINFSNADLSALPGGELREGMWVEVHGHINDDRITAERIVKELGRSVMDILNQGDEVSVQGTIFCSTTCNTHFVVDEFQVDATNAVLLPTDLLLEEGLVVQVKGVWSGYELSANKILLRRGRIELEASVASSDGVDGKVALQLIGGSVAVHLDDRMSVGAAGPAYYPRPPFWGHGFTALRRTGAYKG